VEAVDNVNGCIRLFIMPILFAITRPFALIIARGIVALKQRCREHREAAQQAENGNTQQPEADAQQPEADPRGWLLVANLNRFEMGIDLSGFEFMTGAEEFFFFFDGCNHFWRISVTVTRANSFVSALGGCTDREGIFPSSQTSMALMHGNDGASGVNVNPMVILI
jgi:hypothetical protein